MREHRRRSLSTAITSRRRERGSVRFGVGFVVVVEGFVFFEWGEFDGDAVGCGGLEVVAVETRQYDSDVVFTAAVVSFFNQQVARLRQVALAVHHDLLNIVRS